MALSWKEKTFGHFSFALVILIINSALHVFNIPCETSLRLLFPLKSDLPRRAAVLWSAPSTSSLRYRDEVCAASGSLQHREHRRLSRSAFNF